MKSLKAVHTKNYCNACGGSFWGLKQMVRRQHIANRSPNQPSASRVSVSAKVWLDINWPQIIGQSVCSHASCMHSWCLATSRRKLFSSWLSMHIAVKNVHFFLCIWTQAYCFLWAYPYGVVRSVNLCCHKKKKCKPWARGAHPKCIATPTVRPFVIPMTSTIPIQAFVHPTKDLHLQPLPGVRSAFSGMLHCPTLYRIPCQRGSLWGIISLMLFYHMWVHICL